VLEPPTFGQVVYIDSYQEGIKAALASADSACEKILTAAISLTTVYGAVIALVAPKEKAADIWVTLPFVGFAAAVVICMWAQSKGIEFAQDDKVSTVKEKITGIINSKRGLARLAVVVLAASLVGAGVIVNKEYGKPPTDAGADKVAVTLSPEALEVLSKSCDGTQNPVRGEIKKSEFPGDLVAITVGAGDCPAGAQTFSLPRESVALVVKE
jgi:hypothetical protein